MLNNKIFEEVKELIDKIANLLEHNSYDKNELLKYETKIKELTGNRNFEAFMVVEYWSWTNLDQITQIACNPQPKKKNLSDEELTEIITKIYNCEYSESDEAHQLDILKIETGLLNISDYIYYPNKVGLTLNADISEIIAKIIEDKNIKNLNVIPH